MSDRVTAYGVAGSVWLVEGWVRPCEDLSDGDESNEQWQNVKFVWLVGGLM